MRLRLSHRTCYIYCYVNAWLQKSLPLLRHSLSLNKMHIDGVRPPPPMSVLPPVLPLSSAAASVLPQLVTTSSSVPLRGATVTAQPVGGVAVQQSTATGIRIGPVAAVPRTAPITQQTLPIAAVSVRMFFHSFITVVCVRISGRLS